MTLFQYNNNIVSAFVDTSIGNGIFRILALIYSVKSITLKKMSGREMQSSSTVIFLDIDVRKAGVF